MNGKSAFIIFVLAAAVAAGAAFFALEINSSKIITASGPKPRTIQLAGRLIEVMIADTAETRARGLSGRETLPRDEGMLFIFESNGIYSFWMKDMNFSIDILWISSAGKIVDMSSRVSPATYPAVFTSRAPARYVLELPAGFLEEYNVKIRDTVEI